MVHPKYRVLHVGLAQHRIKEQGQQEGGAVSMCLQGCGVWSLRVQC